MYVRMIRRTEAGNLTGGTENRWNWKTVFSGRFPEGTEEKEILEMLGDGAPGVAEETANEEKAETLVEMRKDIDRPPVYKTPDGNIAAGPESGETVRDVARWDGFEKYCNMLVLLPEKRPYSAWIEDKLESLQRAVRGYIEFTYPFDDDCIVIGNDEAKLIGMKGNRRINGEIYAGPLLLVRDDQNGGLASLRPQQIEKYSRMFDRPESISDEEVDGSIKIEVYAI